MKTLSKIILTGILSFSPLIAEAPDPIIKYIPLENKLREIEKTKDGICVHKAMRYYINAKEAGVNAYLIVGWLNNSNVWHAWVGIDKGGKTYYVDPAWNIPQVKDGLPKEFYLDRKVIYVFDSNVSIEEFVNNKKQKKKDEGVIKEFKSKIKNPKKYEKGQKDNLIKTVEDYCKQDSSAWNYYLTNIVKK